MSEAAAFMGKGKGHFVILEIMLKKTWRSLRLERSGREENI